MRTRIPLFAIILALAPASSIALDFKDGLAAYKRGDLAHAARIFTMLAERGDTPAQFALGMLYDKGNGVKRDDAKAAEWYTRSAEAGYARAQLNLSLMYQNGEGVAQDDSLAHQWLREAAMQGNEDAVSRLQGNAEEADVEAQFDLAGMYATGTGVEEDVAQARKWYGRAAAAGEARAQYNLGVLAANVYQYVEAAGWYEKAARQKHAAAAYNLALLLLDGDGVEQDASRAMTLLKQAATAGIAGAQYQLGLLMADETRPQADVDAAREWFERAARAGHVPSQVNLGTIFATRVATADALVTACAWYMIAAESSPLAKKNLQRISARLSEVELAKARNLLSQLLEVAPEGDA